MKMFTLDRTNNRVLTAPYNMSPGEAEAEMTRLLETPVLNQWCEHNCFTDSDTPLCMCGKNLIAFSESAPMVPRWWKHQLMEDYRVKSTPQYGSFNRNYGQVYADTNKIYCATPAWTEDLAFPKYKKIFMMVTKTREVHVLPRYMEYNFKLNRFNGVKDWIPGDCFCDPSCDNFMDYAVFYGFEAPRMPKFFHHTWNQNKNETGSSMRFDGEMVAEWRIDSEGTWHKDEDRDAPSDRPPGFPSVKNLLAGILGVRL